MCQEFIRTLSHALPPSTLSALTPSVHISIIGCGQSELIPMYAAATNCAFDLYADPSRRLYEGLGLTSTLTLGARPAYLHSSMATNMWRSVVQGLKAGTAMARGGSLTQVGGEFLFDGRGECVWAHRMHSTRDHAEVPELRRVLGMPVAAEDGTGAAAAGAAQEEKSVTVGVPKVVMEERSAMVSAGSGAGIA